MSLNVQLALGFTLLLGTPSLAQVHGAAAGTHPEEAAIRHLMQDFEVAWRQGDAPALARLWAEESDLGLLGGVPRTRGTAEHERAFAEAFSRRTSEVSRHMEIATVRFLLPDVAIVDGAFHYGAGRTPAGEAIPPRREPFVSVIVRKDGGWWFAAGRSGPSVAVPPSKP
jgi:uncharacterized protein (TIGR02246 family)